MSKIENKIQKGVYSLSDLEDKALSATQWGAIGPKMYKALASTHERLPGGSYVVTEDRNDGTIIFLKKETTTDDIIHFKDSQSKDILAEVTRFWDSEKAFKKYGFLHRRGILLYGPAGSGKSSILQQLATDVISRDGIVLICNNPKFFNKALLVFRQAEPERELVCLFEDIDAIIRQHGEDEVLSILDGTNMVDRVLNVATTNFPEILDKRIVSRPRRFDRVIKVGIPTESMRMEYISKKIKNKKDVEAYVKATAGLSFAGMAEAIISVECLGIPLKETIKILTDLEKGHPSSDDFGTKGSLGFTDPSNKRLIDDDDDL